MVPLVHPKAAPKSTQSLHCRCNSALPIKAIKSQTQTVAQDHQQKRSWGMSCGLSQIEFGPTRKENEDEGQCSENIDDALEGRGPYPVQDRTKRHANQQQYDRSGTRVKA